MERLSILVSSFDNYSDLWPPFFQLFHKYWPENKSDLYLITNNVSYNENNVNCLHLSKNNSWSESVKQALNQINSEYVLFTLEDFLVKEKVKTEEIKHVLQFAIDNKSTAVYLNKNRFSHIRFSSLKKFQLINNSRPYVVSTQAAIWNRIEFLKYLDSEESAWDFEKNGSLRAKNINGKFYCVNDNLFNYFHHSVEKGKWFPSEIKRLHKLGIYPDLKMRKIMTRREVIMWYIRKLLGGVVIKFK